MKLILCSIFAIGLTAPAFGGEKEGRKPAATKDWDIAKPATAVAKGQIDVVYRFTDDVGGKKAVCYFVESGYGNTIPGGVTCVLSDKE